MLFDVLLNDRRKIKVSSEAKANYKLNFDNYSYRAQDSPGGEEVQKMEEGGYTVDGVAWENQSDLYVTYGPWEKEMGPNVTVSEVSKSGPLINKIIGGAVLLVVIAFLSKAYSG